MLSVTIQFDAHSKPELLASREFLDQLIAISQDPDERPAFAGTTNESHGPSHGPDLAEQAVNDLWNRVGDSAHELLAAAAEINGKFAMADIAEALDEELSVIVSRFANLGRSIKRTRERVPGAPTFFEEEDKTADGWTFTMPQSIRDAITQKAGEDR